MLFHGRQMFHEKFKPNGSRGSPLFILFCWCSESTTVGRARSNVKYQHSIACLCKVGKELEEFMLSRQKIEEQWLETNRPKWVRYQWSRFDNQWTRLLTGSADDSRRFIAGLRNHLVCEHQQAHLHSDSWSWINSTNEPCCPDCPDCPAPQTMHRLPLKDLEHAVGRRRSCWNLRWSAPPRWCYLMSNPNFLEINMGLGKINSIRDAHVS